MTIRFEYFSSSDTAGGQMDGFEDHTTVSPANLLNVHKLRRIQLVIITALKQMQMRVEGERGGGELSFQLQTQF